MRYNKLFFAILIMFFTTQNFSQAAFWHTKNPELGNEIKQEEYPLSHEVEPRLDKRSDEDTLTIQGGIEKTIDINLEDCLKFALGNNPRIQVAMQDVFASDARIKQAFKLRFKSITSGIVSTEICSLYVSGQTGPIHRLPGKLCLRQ